MAKSQNPSVFVIPANAGMQVSELARLRVSELARLRVSELARLRENHFMAPRLRGGDGLGDFLGISPYKQEKILIKRIVSLTPSITETIFALGAGDRVVGITDACDFPPEVHSRQHVCSWFDPDMDRIVNLKPDLVLGLATAHQRLAPDFEAHGIRLKLFNPTTVEEAFTDMISMGTLLDIPAEAHALVQGLRKRMEVLDAQVPKFAPYHRLTVTRVLEINNENLIVAGPRSFQYDVIRRGGGINVITEIDEAYPRVPFKRFRSWDPQMIFLCGADKNRLKKLKADMQWRELTAVKTGRIYQFDCGLTCRTGPRIVDMAELLFQTLCA